MDKTEVMLCPYCKMETRLSEKGICCNCGARLFRAVYEVTLKSFMKFM